MQRLNALNFTADVLFRLRLRSMKHLMYIYIKSLQNHLSIYSLIHTFTRSKIYDIMVLIIIFSFAGSRL